MDINYKVPFTKNTSSLKFLLAQFVKENGCIDYKYVALIEGKSVIMSDQNNDLNTYQRRYYNNIWHSYMCGYREVTLEVLN